MSADHDDVASVRSVSSSSHPLFPGVYGQPELEAVWSSAASKIAFASRPCSRLITSPPPGPVAREHPRGERAPGEREVLPRSNTSRARSAGRRRRRSRRTVGDLARPVGLAPGWAASATRSFLRKNEKAGHLPAMGVSGFHTCSRGNDLRDQLYAVFVQVNRKSLRRVSRSQSVPARVPRARLKAAISDVGWRESGKETPSITSPVTEGP